MTASAFPSLHQKQNLWDKGLDFGKWSQRTWGGDGQSNTGKEEINTRVCFQASHGGSWAPSPGRLWWAVQTVPRQHTPHPRGRRGEPLSSGSRVGLWGANPLAFPIARESVRESEDVCQCDACANLAAAVRAPRQRGPHVTTLRAGTQPAHAQTDRVGLKLLPSQNAY